MKIRSAVTSLGRKSYGSHETPAEDSLLECALGTNVFGTSPRVIDFAAHFDWSAICQYPDNSYDHLKEALCHFWSDYAGLELENIKVCNGSSCVLSNLNKMLIDPGDEVLGCVPQFVEYKYDAALFGGKYRAVSLMAEDDFKFNLDCLMKAITPLSKIVYLNNPNNPTGEFIDLEQIETLMKETAKRKIITIIDEAYGDYLEERFSAINLINKYSNLIVTRTFSKCYGIAQARVGYGVMSEKLGHYYNEIDLPFSVGTVGAEIAQQALLDHQFILSSRQSVKTEKAKVVNELKIRGFNISASHESCPIFVAGRPESSDNLGQYFLSKKIHVLPGTYFDNLSAQFVRINTPVSAQDFIERLSKSQSVIWPNPVDPGSKEDLTFRILVGSRRFARLQVAASLD